MTCSSVAFGVLLDTIIVRSILVTALNLDLGPRIWWPNRLAHDRDVAPAEAPRLVREAAGVDEVRAGRGPSRST